jgi:hypothetical protein
VTVLAADTFEVQSAAQDESSRELNEDALLAFFDAKCRSSAAIIG